MAMEKKSKWMAALKVILWLIVLSFAIAFLISLFIEDDFESLDGNVAVIEITGPIVTSDDGYLFEDVASSDEIIKLIRKADKNDGIKAIVFEINSPGGSAVASDEIAAEIKKVNKTTVALVREIGTSGAYWIASSTDHIVANRMSITGSIGVIASYLGFEGFLEEHNVTYERLVSGKFKDLGSPFKELTPEERALFEKSLDTINDYFIDEVAKNRNLNRKEVERLATGQFYLGVDALNLGLVDELGSKDEAKSYVEKQIGQEADFVKYKTQKGFLGSLSDIADEASFFVGRGIGSAFFAKAESPKSIRITA
ncbi:signal peptide peptidase SppA [Candidatus Woesearchaeota archaeon]|nr:signal peptide peptidase SppA [Candidatus Woesearchaeota archaeon]